MKMKITQKQALKMADNIMGCFGIYGYGHFDLIIDEYANVLMLAFNTESCVEKSINKYYEELNAAR
jgi:hypothetical protein